MIMQKLLSMSWFWWKILFWHKRSWSPWRMGIKTSTTHSRDRPVYSTARQKLTGPNEAARRNRLGCDVWRQRRLLKRRPFAHCRSHRGSSRRPVVYLRHRYVRRFFHSAECDMSVGLIFLTLFYLICIYLFISHNHCTIIQQIDKRRINIRLHGRTEVMPS